MADADASSCSGTHSASKRLKTSTTADPSESDPSESLVHSSSYGPKTVLHLHTNGGKNSVNLSAGEIVVFGRDPELPDGCTSDESTLGLPPDLAKPPRTVHSLKIDDNAVSYRHGYIWADSGGDVFLRALPTEHDGTLMCKGGIRVKLGAGIQDWIYAVSKKQTDLQAEYRVPNYATKLCVDRKKVEWQVHLDFVATPSSCELLCLGCSPESKPLVQVGSEINQIAHECQWGPGKVSLAWGCTAASLEAELKSRPTLRIHFAAHMGGKLGFTQPGGELEPLQPDALASLLVPYSPSRGGKLQLVFLNGCNSEALGRRLHVAGIPCVVCWRTVVDDTAAKIFACAFFKACATAAKAAVPPPAGHAGVVAFDKACEALRTVKKKRKLPSGEFESVLQFEIKEPPSLPHPAGPVKFPWASGLPVLLLEGRGVVRVGVESCG